MNKNIFTPLLAMLLSGSFASFAQSGNFGIGTVTPTNKLHVVDTADPVRIQGLSAANSATVGTLVIDTAGVVKVRTVVAMSAVDVLGTTGFTTDNTYDFTDWISAPAVSDAFGEFSGHTFTAKQTGLYYVTFFALFPQRPSTQDGGDGYDGILEILAGTATGAPLTAPVLNTGASRIPARQAAYASGGFTTATVSALKGLTQGQVFQFKMATSGLSPVNLTGVQYRINIARID